MDEYYEQKSNETKNWKCIKKRVYGAEETKRRNELEKDFESFKTGLLLKKAREGKNLTSSELDTSFIEQKRNPK